MTLSFTTELSDSQNINETNLDINYNIRYKRLMTDCMTICTLYLFIKACVYIYKYMETFPSNTHKDSFIFFPQNIMQSKIFLKLIRR